MKLFLSFVEELSWAGGSTDAGGLHKQFSLSENRKNPATACFLAIRALARDLAASEKLKRVNHAN
jgi:hypothetical protein